MASEFKLTTVQQDEFLELVLPCENQELYERALVQFGSKYGRDPALSIEEGNKWLRRRARRRSDYEGPSKEIGFDKGRKLREGLPWSYVELRIIEWVRTWESEGVLQPTPAYLSDLLQRSCYEIIRQINIAENTRDGVEALF